MDFQIIVSAKRGNSTLSYGFNTLSIRYIIYAKVKQKHLGCKKGEANQKQQLSDYGYIHSYILATKNFDIKLRPRIN